MHLEIKLQYWNARVMVKQTIFFGKYIMNFINDFTITFEKFPSAIRLSNILINTSITAA